MAEEQDLPAAGLQKNYREQRREERYKVPNDCRQYIQLRVKNGNEAVPAVLGNFSRSGILFECPIPFNKGEHTECIIAISLLVARELSFRIEVKYCYMDKGTYLMGASIDAISDEAWFDLFVEVHDFIMLRRRA